ncbi:MAG: hypothetical protein DCC71_11195 [Proteobacteria bacterium]|nr:MAG: hypothetical protein DCC71_11195 [Pseudomonadota bacterium]
MRARALCEAASASAPPRPVRREPDDPRQRAALDCLRREPLSRDELGARLGASAAELGHILLPLELDGRIAEERDGTLRVALDP